MNANRKEQNHKNEHTNLSVKCNKYENVNTNVNNGNEYKYEYENVKVNASVNINVNWKFVDKVSAMSISRGHGG